MRTTLCATLLLAFASQAQDLGQYNRALSAFNTGDFDAAAQAFFELEQTSTDPDIRAKSEYYLAESFLRKGLPVTAFIYFAYILKTGKQHPFYLKSVEGLVNVQEQLGDEYLIPSLLNRNYSDDWATLPLDTLARINYMIGVIDQRLAKFDEGKSFLESVGSETSAYAKAQYLLEVMLSDPRFPGGPKPDNAIKAFQNVLNLKAGASVRQPDYEQTRELAMLGLGRVYYGMGQYQKSTEWYDQVPRFSKYWDQALFENGFARFQNDDYGGALGSLQALHAPQFAGAFQPESWILKATIYYFSCLYDESNAALKSYDEIYLPMADKLKPIVEGDHDNDWYYRTVADENSETIPRPVLLWVRNNQRMLGVFQMLKQIDVEKELISGNQAWSGSKIGATVIGYLDGNRATLIRTAGNLAKSRLAEANHNIRFFADQAEIVRFENSKAQKELFEQGIDMPKLLAQKRLYRPAMPAEDWNYWKFQGEFWIDEIGYYQYTLKKACPKSEE